jgi:hypothetical protein
VIPPGGWSSQRHWHSHEDEFVWVVEGELTLVTNAGEEILRTGDCAAFKAGDPDGHHLVNRSDRPAKVLEIGNSDPRDRCVYSDIDMVGGPGAAGYSHRDGAPYPSRRDRLSHLTFAGATLQPLNLVVSLHESTRHQTIQPHRCVWHIRRVRPVHWLAIFARPRAKRSAV